MRRLTTPHMDNKRGSRLYGQRLESQTWKILCGLALLVATILTPSCRQEKPAATPTPTRTPILPTSTPTPLPTSTPTATPTVTPTPTPTLPPGLIFTGEAADAADCPPSPADLHFLRDGDLWICHSEGGPPEQINPPDEATDSSIIKFEVSTDRRSITYVRENGYVGLLDRALWQATAIPTAGRIIDAHGTYLELLGDAEELVYLAWGVQTDPGPALSSVGSGVLLSVNAISPTLRQQVLGNCKGESGSPCAGFLVSPNQAQIAIADSNGIWLLDRSKDGDKREEPQYLGLRPDGPLYLHSWSPDNKWILLATHENTSEASPAFSLLSVNAIEEPIAFRELCAEPCRADATWAESSDGAKLWLTWDSNSEGCIASVDTGAIADNVFIVKPDQRICETQTVRLHPTSPLAGPAATTLGGLVTFLQSTGPGISAGIYALDAQASLRGVALLPGESASVLWHKNGDAFLVLDAEGNARRMGTPQSGILWNVETLLSGAENFVWRSAE